MKKMQYELNPFISKANEREAAYSKWVKDKANTENVLRGGASGTEPDKRYLSTALAEIMDVRAPNAAHQRGTMDMTTWIGWSDNEQQEALTVVKDAGFLDSSLEQLGKRIVENICAEGWQRWLSHQTMLINEYRLTPINAEHRRYLEGEMEKFFFGGGSQPPQGFVPE